MNKINYNAEMIKTLKALGEKKPNLLLHACCAPCSSSCLERLKDYFNITVFFYNPNIEDEEYLKRKQELIRLITQTGWAKLADCEHGKEAFYAAAKGLEGCPEGGARCEKCFTLRLRRTAEEAKRGGFDYFCTTLTLSPLKSATLINGIGESIAGEVGVKWLYSDFKKANGYLRSLQLSKQYSLYRQSYCGCVYSKNATCPNA